MSSWLTFIPEKLYRTVAEKICDRPIQHKKRNNINGANKLVTRLTPAYVRIGVRHWCFLACHADRKSIHLCL